MSADKYKSYDLYGLSSIVQVVPGVREIRICSPSIPCRPEVKVYELYPKNEIWYFHSGVTFSEEILFPYFTSFLMGIIRIILFLLQKMRSLILSILMGVGAGLDR